MIPMRSRRRLLLCATLLAGVAAAEATAATTVSLDGPDSRFGSPGTVYVTGGGARSHAIDVVYRSDTDSFVITDSRRFGTLDSGCERLKRRRVRCQSPAPKGPADVTIIGGKRDDRLRVDATVKGFSRLDGQNGDNLLRIAAMAGTGSSAAAATIRSPTSEVRTWSAAAAGTTSSSSICAPRIGGTTASSPGRAAIWSWPRTAIATS